MLVNNLIIKNWKKIAVSFALLYPNQLELMLSSYTIRLLYEFLNADSEVACELFYLPKGLRYPASRDLLNRNDIRSLENHILPVDFDVIGISLHSEEDIKNIFWFLDKSSIPIERSQRHSFSKESGKIFPFIIAGGPVITSNPLALSNCVDAFFIGDSEPNLIRFIEVFKAFKLKQLTPQQFFEELRHIEGIYLPEINNITKRVYLSELDQSKIPIKQLNAIATQRQKAFENNFFIEVNRGCPFSCNFCISSYHNRPFRNRSYEAIVDAINEACFHSEFQKISLIGSCVSSHPNFPEICKCIIAKKKQISIPSIRIEHVTDEVIAILEKGDVKTITLAPETGSEELRYTLGKKITNDLFFEIMTKIEHSKIRNVKLYFLIGLPEESEGDIEELISIVHELGQLGFDKKALRINVNPFVPKLNTPYEFETNFYQQANIPILIKRFELIQKELKNVSSIKLKIKNPKEIMRKARIQALISLADSSISEFLLKYYYNGANFNSLKKVEELEDLSIDEYLEKVKQGYKAWKIN
jgi:radical SAM superfamily enzyme YgiQ (UPF0313 family)